jgi:predicted ATP-binding protein involved in virulence
MGKCREAGMKATWVMTEEEKVEKKAAAKEKKRIKTMNVQSGSHTESTLQLPVSSYLKKRAKCKTYKTPGNIMTTASQSAMASSEVGASEKNTQDSSSDDDDDDDFEEGNCLIMAYVA